MAKPVIKINGQLIDYSLQNGYAAINRTWNRKDVVEVFLPMEIRRVVANEKLKDNLGKVALQRGPLMYCAEWMDNHGKTSNIILPRGTNFTSEFTSDLLNGVMVLNAVVPAVNIQNNENVFTQKQTFRAIPYYSWANRGKGEMMVWFPEQIKGIDLLAK